MNSNGKKTVLSLLCLFLGLVIGFGGYLIYDLATEDDAPASNGNNVFSGVYAVSDGNRGLIDSSYNALSYLKAGDFISLADMVHPEYGIYFSPYSNINLSSNQWFSSAEVSRLGKQSDSLVWGVYDGSGEPISLTVSEYFERFVYDSDYLSAPIVTVNRISRSGNALENIQEVFPDGQFVDFYIPPTLDEEGYEELDWAVLRLVYEEHDGLMYLVAIVHSEHTV